MRALLFLIILVSVTGCKSTGRYEAANTWVGSHFDALAGSWGMPSHVSKLTEKIHVFDYMFDDGIVATSIPGYGGITLTNAAHKRCKVSFYTKEDGIIFRVQASGNNC